jgi:thiol-disulfide isomerase/thioredoxin
MDRLPAVVTPRARGCALAVMAAALLTACDGGDKAEPAAAEAPGSRFVAVVKQEDQRSPEAFCDTYAPGDDAQAFQAPPLADDGQVPSRGWRWINLWATWCKPCVEEMPLLQEWAQKLAGEGVQFDLVFLSVDEDADTVTAFRKTHTGIPDTLRIESLEALPTFLGDLGLDEGTPIPIQVFVDGDQRIRCIRAGAVNPDDYSAVRALIRG